MKSVRLSVAPLTGTETRATGSAWGVELGPEVRQLLLVELVLVRVRLEDLFLELSELLRLVDEGAGFQFSKLGQFSSLLLKLLQRTRAWWAPHLLERYTAAP